MQRKRDYPNDPSTCPHDGRYDCHERCVACGTPWEVVLSSTVRELETPLTGLDEWLPDDGAPGLISPAAMRVYAEQATAQQIGATTEPERVADAVAEVPFWVHDQRGLR